MGCDYDLADIVGTLDSVDPGWSRYYSAGGWDDGEGDSLDSVSDQRWADDGGQWAD